MKTLTTTSLLAGAFALVSMVACEGDPRDTTRWSTSQASTAQDDAGVPTPDAQTPSPGNSNGCDDGNKSTVDSRVDGTCVHKPIQCNTGWVLNELGECARSMTACEPVDDSDACTIDSCDPTTGAAVHNAKCESGDANINSTCEASTGNCIIRCVSDDDPCTIERFNDAGSCISEEIACGAGLRCNAGTCEVAPCADNAACSDGNGCTRDVCNAGTCEHTPFSGSCDDGDAATTDVCQPSEGGEANEVTCQNIEQNPEQPADCQQVDDNNPCTVDVCQDGAPAHLAVSCDDQDDGTSDSCNSQNGQCVHSAICPAGQAFDMNSHQCVPAQVDAECVNDEVACRQFEASNNLVLARCQDGVWVQTQVCGALNTAICFAPATCGPAR